jgi:hypothetical protein
VHRFARWLAIVAIALQVAWPLLVNAKPHAVVLVPLCNVDGVTHYLEQLTGKTPLEECYSHGAHCSFCFFGERLALPLASGVAQPSAHASETPHPASGASVYGTSPQLHGARAPPSRVVATSNDNNHGRSDATASASRRAAAGAGDRVRFVRGGILLG